MIACAVCGAPVRPRFVPPDAELAPDLDFRPGEPSRSTVRRWVGECFGCGAAAPDLALLTPGDAAVVRDDPEYAAIRQQAPAFARPVLLWALLCQRGDRPWGAAEALLQAAWIADDAEDEGWATAWRQQTARLWPQSAEIRPRLCLLDILRRAGDFQQAAALAEDLATDERLDPSSAAILDFQRRLIAGRETGRQMLSSALRPPATRPHVSHAGIRAARGGFWQRLMGRG